MTDTLLQAVDEVARLAGEAAHRHFLTDLAVETKADGTPVTLADRQAEGLARQWVERHFPGDGFVGEESGTSGDGARRRWLVDPIDGTKAFVHGVPLWGTLVAVAEGEEVLAGAMAFPALGQRVAAERGKGCFVNGAQARVSQQATLGQATVLTTDVGALSPGLGRLLSRAKVARTWGDCFGYLLVATGRAEVMVDQVMAPWDSACLLPIIEEAGGVFTDLHGRRTAFGGHSVATNAALAAEVRALLAVPPAQPGLTLPALEYGKGGGLVTVVAQHALSGEVLMVAHGDAESMQRTAETGLMHYRSRSRGLWKKGQTSGHTQRVVSLTADCDADAVLARVLPDGPACHNNTPSCFDGAPAAEALGALDRTLSERKASLPTGSYTRRLYEDRNLRLKKLGEEAAELVVALADGDGARAAEEAADLTYHVLAALKAAGLGLDEVREVLARRAAGKG